MSRSFTLAAASLGLLLTTPAWAASPVGVWKTISDTDGEPASHVEIWEQDGKLRGKVVHLYRDPGEDPNPLCTACTGPLANKPIIGMTILQDLEADGTTYEGGEILDPDNGKTYSCKIWLSDDNTLSVRGYWGFLYRTQTWHRVQ